LINLAKTRRAFPAYLLLAVLAASLSLTIVFADRAQSGPLNLTTMALAKDVFLAQALYAVPKRMASNIDDNGAIGVNRSPDSSQMFIEEQRYSGDIVQTGLCTGDANLVNQGVKAMEWGFKQQARDGSFPRTGDPFHSVSMFVEGTARALLSLKECGGGQYAAVVNALTPRVLAAADWLIEPEVEQKGKANNAPYTHRRWILAAALGETAALTRDESLARKSEEYARDGLSMQQSDGIDPEKGGYDVSYQAVGILMAERYYVVCSDSALKAHIKKMIALGCDWELTMITAGGQVTTGNSTRVGNEKSRSGKVKHVNTKELLQALSYATTITANPVYRERAVAVARANNWY
jgi:hypothetical protein